MGEKWQELKQDQRLIFHKFLQRQLKQLKLQEPKLLKWPRQLGKKLKQRKWRKWWEIVPKMLLDKQQLMQQLNQQWLLLKISLELMLMQQHKKPEVRKERKFLK